MKSPRSFKLSF